MTEQIFQDGWDHQDLEQAIVYTETDDIRYRGEKGLSILQAKHHSLEPDMISGWKPKLPSCPLPLSYPNAYVDSLMNHLTKDDTYSVTYIGPRYVNSVQINQQYAYDWRYRERYSLNLAIVQQAIKKVGNEELTKIKITKSDHSFDSAFQSGNLDLAVCVKKNQYDCFIRSDTNTKGHTNWYYFKVQNNGQIGPIRINICNMTKCRNLYSKGMKPYTRIGQVGEWSQEECYEVVFVQRYCRYGFDLKNYQLQFTFNFSEPHQTVYFAYSIPYTYSDLENFIKEIKVSHPLLIKTKKLCQTLGGVQVPLLTITNPQSNCQQIQNSPNNSEQGSQFNKKKHIIIAGRIHPGQSNSSYMMQGFIRQLLKDTQASQILRKMFVFHIVPMLNPDGVIAGNFRTSYSGKDLNRQFNKFNKYIFPEITALVEFCQNIKKSNHRGVEFYFDFHGHSAKKNLFCYGPEHQTTKSYFFKARALAKIIEKMSPIFSYRKSIFTISEQKKNTARAYMLRNLRIPMTFTFEISNGIYENEAKKDVLLDRSILLHTGQIIVNGLYRYAQLQMRIPKKCIKAKVDTGFVKHRKLNSAGASRRGDTLKKRSMQETSQIRYEKGKSVQKASSLEKGKQEENKQFIALIKQIKREQREMEEQAAQIQGGSDSESEGEDFSKEESNNLFQQIMKRSKQAHTNSYGYIIREQKKSKTVKLQYKKKENQQNQLQNSLKDILPVQNKKFRSNKMIQLSRPPIPSSKNIRRGISIEYQKVVLAQKNFTMLL